MTERLQSEILALLAEADRHEEKIEPVDEVLSEFDLNVSDVLLEAIKKSQETNNLKCTPDDNAFANSFLTFNSDEDWGSMKTALLDALNTSTSGAPESPDSDEDEMMHMERESDGEKHMESGSDGENLVKEVESRHNIFEIWKLDIDENSDEEIGLERDLKQILSNDTDISTDSSTVAGSAKGERSNLDDLGGHTENVDELVANLGNLSLDPVEGSHSNFKNLKVSPSTKK